MAADDGRVVYSPKFLRKWCECLICGDCWAGVTETCPNCGAGAPDPEEYAVVTPAAEPKGDMSAWVWLGSLAVVVAVLMFFDWLLS